MDSSAAYLATLREIVDRLLPGSAASGGDETPLAERGLDSVGMIDLLASVEERFELQVPPSEIRPENFSNLQALASLVARLKGPC